MFVYLSRLEHQEEICEGTIALQLMNPAASHFCAGQSVEITVIKPRRRDIGGDSQTFSIASTPFEDKLMFVYALSNSAFKEELRSLAGSEIQISGASENFFLHEDPGRPAVFLV